MLAWLLGPAAISLVGIWLLLRPRRIRRDHPAPALEQCGFSHQLFEQVLQGSVSQSGDVDYPGLLADPAQLTKLDAYVAQLGLTSPDAEPERFPSREERMAFWLYAYNALVLRAVLDHWPLQSVTQVHGVLEPTTGFGFFYRLRYLVGGEWLSLYHLEHRKVLERAADPRVHFVLNCASGGCPALRPELPVGEALEPFLQQSAEDFVADRANVAIDHGARVLRLSKIFDWYQKDFLAELKRRGQPSDQGLLAYLLLVAPASLKADLERAGTYRVEFFTYDWTINSPHATSRPPA